MATYTGVRLGATTVTADTDTALFQAARKSRPPAVEFTVCNRGTTQLKFRVAIVDGAITSVADEDYKFYDATLAAKATFTIKPGWILPATFSILVRSDSTDASFSASGITRS